MNEPNDTIFDVSVIGTSPISIFNVLLNHKNKKILMLDKNSSLGGNWSVSKIFGYKNVETGPHFIKIRKNEESIFSYFGIEIEKNIFKPIYIINNFFFKLQDRGLVEIYKNYHSEKFLTQKILLLLKFILLCIKTVFVRNSTNYIYPKNGCSNLLKQLEALMNKENIDLKLNTHVLEVISMKEKTKIITNRGVFYSKKCILSSGYQSIKLLVNKKKINDIHLSSKKNNQVHLLINEKPSRKPFYYKTINNEFLAINDLSHFSELHVFKKHKKRILSIRLSENKNINNMNNLKQEIHKFLITRKIIRSNSSIINFKLTKLPNKVRREEEIEKLNKLTDSKIEFLYSFDLSTAMNILKDKLKPSEKY